MTDDLRELLNDAVADVEPADRLGEIRARVGRPSRRPWRYAVGGAVLATAATVAAVAVLTHPPSTDPAPAESGPADPDLEAAHPVYYLGETPAGTRLFREFHAGEGPLFPDESPDDLDYQTLWPPAASFSSVSLVGDELRVEIADAGLRDAPAGVTPELAELSIQQVVYTFQGVFQRRVPVRFLLDGEPLDQLYGVPVDQPVTAAPQLDTLALVSISDPTEGRVVDRSFSARGVANAYEGNVVLSLAKDGETAWEQPIIADGAYGDRLWPWQLQDIDVSGLEPGTYTFTATVESPSEADRGPEPWTDTRTVVIE
jgi:hypothetical protein